MFKINKKIYIILLAAVMFAGSFVLINNARAADFLNIEFEHTPLFSEANIMPGDSATRWIKVDNIDTTNHTIAAKIDGYHDPDGLGEEMRVVIREGGGILYANNLFDFFNNNEVYLSDLAPGAQTQYDISIILNYGTMDEYQRKSLSFDIIIGAQAEESIGGESGADGSGAGGGYSYQDLIISNEQIGEIGFDYAVITWLTNKFATSRVIYDAVSHEDIGKQSPPNYGYTFSTPEDAVKVTEHSVTVTGLIPQTIYYFRPLSKASPEKYGRELAFITTASGEVVVLGEAGAPDLTAVKVAKSEFVNPGDLSLQYEITITNNGNLSAYGVNIFDHLPDGFTYSSTGASEKSWLIGDIAPKEFKSITYLTAVSSEAQPGIYTNTAAVYASNHNSVAASASVEIRNTEVLGAGGGFLDPSGFSNKELFFILAIIIFIGVAVIVLKRKFI